MPDLLLLIIFLVLLLLVMRSASKPEAVQAVANLVGALDRRHTDRSIEIEHAKKPEAKHE